MNTGERNRPHLIIITGTNGVGKSTLGMKLQEDYNFPFIDIDQIYYKTYGSFRNYTKEEIIETSEKIRSTRDSFFQRNQSFVVEKILNDPKSFDALIKNARRHNYCVSLFYLGVDEMHILTNRINRRYATGLHYVRPDIVKKNHQDMKKNFKYAAEKVDLIAFYDTRKMFSRVYTEDKNGNIVCAKAMPNWVVDILCNTSFVVGRENSSAKKKYNSKNTTFKYAR